MNAPPKKPDPLTPDDEGYLPREKRPKGYLWEKDEKAGDDKDNDRDKDKGDDDELFDDVPV